MREVAGGVSVAGRGSVSLVYVHGLGESGLGFEPLLAHDRLAGWRQLAVDMPGYGKSPWCEEPLPLDAQAERLVRWLESRAIAEVIVVGHSMGGVIGAELCRRLAGRVRGFLNVEGNVSLGDCGFSSRASASTREGFMEEGFDRLLDELYRAGLDDPAQRTYYSSMRFCDPRAYHLNSLELVETSRREEQAERMAALGVPGLYVLGNPRGTGAESRALLERAGVEWRAVENAGHWPFLDQTEKFLDVMCSFLDTLESHS